MGVLIAILSAAIINVILILLLLSFVFNRKNNKKKMIWSFIISLIAFGSGVGLILVGTLNFEYIENDQDILKAEYMELDMQNDLVFGTYPVVEYIESDNDNIKIEYTINKYCNINHSNSSESVIHMWSNCDNPIKLAKEVINNLNDKKIISINNELQNVKIYTAKENIEILKKNYKDYTNVEVQTQNMINSYESRIDELQQKIDEYIQKESDYQEKINNLKYQIIMYQNENE